MGRLTEHKAEGIYLIKTGYRNCENYCETRDSCDDCAIQEALDKLAHYEDLEEECRLIELPCAVGDTVWQITRNFISEFKIKSFVCDNEGIFFYWECISGIYINILGFSNNRIGKDVFLTKEEAERKLEELKGE